MKSKVFRYGFLIFFFAMFFVMLWNTYLVFSDAQELKEVVTLLWTFKLPWQWAYHGTLFHPGVAQFAFGFYSVMLTSITSVHHKDAYDSRDQISSWFPILCFFTSFKFPVNGMGDTYFFLSFGSRNNGDRKQNTFLSLETFHSVPLLKICHTVISI